MKDRFILVAEEEDSVRERIVRTLSTDGYDTVSFKSTSEAVVHLLKNSDIPSLILLGMKKPFSDDVGFLYKKAEDPDFAHTPVLVMLNENDQISPDELPENADVIPKHINIDKLIDIVRHMMML